MEQRDLLFFAMWHARCELLRHGTKESCILSTKILCDLFNQLGVRAMPVAVDVIGMDKIAVEMSERGEDIDVTDPECKGFAYRCKVDPDNEDPEGSTWPGHLVLVAGRWMFDPSADQFSRDEYGCEVRPLMVEFESDEEMDTWLNDGERRGIKLPEGGLISYEAHPDVLTYRISSDWEDSKPGDPLWESVMAKTHGLMGIYEDVEELPDLPDLPPGRSHNEPMTPENMAKNLESIAELGYNLEDLVKRQEEEQGRIERRRAIQAQRRGQDLHHLIDTKANQPATANWEWFR